MEPLPGYRFSPRRWYPQHMTAAVSIGWQRCDLTLVCHCAADIHKAHQFDQEAMAIAGVTTTMLVRTHTCGAEEGVIPGWNLDTLLIPYNEKKCPDVHEKTYW